MDYLPNIRTLLRRGSFGYLRSTIPPISAPAWVSMMTGMNPAKTGVFDWITMSNKIREKPKTVCFNDVKEPKIWDILSRNGMRSCVVNLPLSYPPCELNGVMVSGIPGHIDDRSITFPNSLKAELDKVVGGYEVNPYNDLRIPGKDAEYIVDFQRVLEKRTKAAIHLMEKEHWDFFMVVFYILDSVQHYFWKHMDKQHPLFNPEYSKEFSDVIKNFYIKIDESIGKLIKLVDNNTNIILVSDHGMGPMFGCFWINNLLMKKGLLVLKGGRTKLPILTRIKNKGLTIMITVGVNSPRILKNIAVKILPFNLKQRLTWGGRSSVRTDQLLDVIDWTKTKAYAVGEGGGIFIRNKSDYSSIKHILEEIEPLSSKRETLLNIYEKNQIYEGPYIDDAPDIYCLIKGYKINTGITLNGEIWSDHVLSGHHTENGLFIAAGPDIKSISYPQKLSIYDIMPTILRLFSIDIPQDVDGSPLLSIIPK